MKGQGGREEGGVGKEGVPKFGGLRNMPQIKGVQNKKEKKVT